MKPQVSQQVPGQPTNCRYIIKQRLQSGILKWHLELQEEELTDHDTLLTDHDTLLDPTHEACLSTAMRQRHLMTDSSIVAQLGSPGAVTVGSHLHKHTTLAQFLYQGDPS